MPGAPIAAAALPAAAGAAGAGTAAALPAITATAAPLAGGAGLAGLGAPALTAATTAPLAGSTLGAGLAGLPATTAPLAATGPLAAGAIPELAASTAVLPEVAGAALPEVAGAAALPEVAGASALPELTAGLPELSTLPEAALQPAAPISQAAPINPATGLQTVSSNVGGLQGITPPSLEGIQSNIAGNLPGAQPLPALQPPPALDPSLTAGNVPPLGGESLPPNFTDTLLNAPPVPEPTPLQPPQSFEPLPDISGEVGEGLDSFTNFKFQDRILPQNLGPRAVDPIQGPLGSTNPIFDPSLQQQVSPGTIDVGGNISVATPENLVDPFGSQTSPFGPRVPTDLQITPPESFKPITDSRLPGVFGDSVTPQGVTSQPLGFAPQNVTSPQGVPGNISPFEAEVTNFGRPQFSDPFATDTTLGQDFAGADVGDLASPDLTNLDSTSNLGNVPGDVQAPQGDILDPQSALKKVGTFAKENPLLTVGGVALLGQAFQDDGGSTRRRSSGRGEEEAFAEFETADIPPDYRPGLDPEFVSIRQVRGFAEGGPVTQTDQLAQPQDVAPETVDKLMQRALLAIQGQTENPQMDLEMLRLVLGDEAFDDFMDTFSGMESPESQGGGVIGPGSGVSDSIPATIDGREPARLSSGEYVVPSDVVSHVGDGDTNAGIAAIDQMMGQIRQAKTGSPASPPKFGTV